MKKDQLMQEIHQAMNELVNKYKHLEQDIAICAHVISPVGDDGGREGGYITAWSAGNPKAAVFNFVAISRESILFLADIGIPAETVQRLMDNFDSKDGSPIHELGADVTKTPSNLN